MKRKQGTTDLEELLDRVESAANDRERVTVGEILDEIGTRSFGPIVLLAGIIILAPVIGDIPGVPTVMGVLVVLTAGQLLFHRDHIWLPNWLLNRSADRDKLLKGLKWIRKPARFVDRMVRPRIDIFVRDGGLYAIAVMCVVIAAATPAMEFVPFSANGAGAALTAFGLALIARDGLLALFAFAFTSVTLGIVVYNLL